MKFFPFSAAAVLLALAATASAQDRTLAFTRAKIIPINGPEIDDGVLLVRDGKIVAVGAWGELDVPEDAVVHDFIGHTIMPGLVDTHNHIGGIGGGDGSHPTQPDVRIYDSLNCRSSGFRRARAGGLTTLNIMPGSGHLLSGQTVYVKTRRAETLDDMFILDKDRNPCGGMKMANGTNSLRDPPFPGTRGKSAAIVRQMFIDAKAYGEKMNRFKDDPEKRPARDIGKDALLEVLSGKRVVHHHTHRHDDIMTVLRLKEEFGFRVVLHHVSEGWMVADEIAKAEVPCSIIIVDSPGGKLEAKNLVFKTGAVLEEAGVKVAYHTDDWITDSRHFLRCAALGVRAGMSREGALRSLTLAGAEMLDLQDRIGSLEPGKDADFIVITNDPLSVYAKVRQTWIEGQLVFDREREDDRLYATGGYGAGEDVDPYLCCHPAGGHE
ncbi:MAG: amidohydrolase family protein [Phycisphaerae bacterium]